MSDTPRTDKVELRRISMECGEPPPNTGDYADLYAEAVEGLRDAERELAAAQAKLSEVEAERNALKIRLEIDPAHPYDGIDCRDQTIKLLEERVDALKEDAERYRWLRDKASLRQCRIVFSSPLNEMDSAIDAARKK